MYLTIKPFLVFVALGVSFGLFFVYAKKLVDLMLAAKGAGPALGNTPARIGAVLQDVILQGRVRRKKAPGLAHSLIFWGFIVITIGTAEMIVEGLFHGVNLMLLGTSVFGVYNVAADFMTLAVLSGVAFGFFRRLVLKPKYLATGRDALLVLTITAALMISLFLMNAFRVAGSPELYADFFPLSSRIWLYTLQGVSPESAFWGQEAFYWMHLGLVLG
ncbi:MAG: hypothetical protein HUU37_09540, partial [Bdellovibrionales bacterium]|nr:hypothetical protein [Bdellovibrionales bacterium]